MYYMEYFMIGMVSHEAKSRCIQEADTKGL